MIDWLRGRPVGAIGLVASLPLLVTILVLLGRPWVPVLDLAMTELRVRDVGLENSPLVGLPGRIGAFPDQGSHPGPWSFYLVALIYRLSGSSAWSMELASVLINTACLLVLIALGKRRYGRAGAIFFGLLAAVAVRGYGLTVLTQPWNPYFPVLLWLLALVAAWFVLAGDAPLAPLVTVCTVVAAQTHVPYLVGAVVLNAVIAGWLVVAVVRERRNLRPGPLKPAVLMFVVAAVAWIPPFVQQIRDGRTGGNIAKLLRHFATDQPEPAIGVGSAAELVTQHFDLVSIVVGLFSREDAFVHQAGQDGRVSPVGMLVLAVWLATGVWAIVRRHRDLITLHVVVALTTLVGLLAISRVFGKLWFYLTLWMSATVLLAAVAIAWTAWIVLCEWRAAAELRHDRVEAIAALTGAAITIVSLTAIAGHQPPEAVFGADVRAIVDDAATALDDGVGGAVGADGTYVVFWQESGAPGTKGYAMLNELERRDYRVGVHPSWRIPATEHRVLQPDEIDAELHVVTGGFIELWRTRGYAEVTVLDDRSDAERQRFDELATRVDSRLIEIGRPELVPSVDENIFRTSLEVGLPRDIVGDLDEMLRIGEPIAVFIAPAGSTA